MVEKTLTFKANLIFRAKNIKIFNFFRGALVLPVSVNGNQLGNTDFLFYPGHPLFQGLSGVQLPLLLSSFLSPGGPSWPSWPISSQRS